MTRLIVDEYTRAIVREVMADRVKEGEDPLQVFSQSLDEDLKRFGVNEETGTSNLISTMSNYHGFRNKKGTYSNTNLIRPGPVPAEKRLMADRFITKGPKFLAKLSGDEKQIRLETLLIKLNDICAIHLDDDTRQAFVLIKCDKYPMTVQKAMSGRNLSEILSHKLDRDPVVIKAQEDENPNELKQLFPLEYNGTTRAMIPFEGMILNVEIDYPSETHVDFKPVYHKNYF
jgi:hypothetical protein